VFVPLVVIARRWRRAGLPGCALPRWCGSRTWYRC